MPRRASEQSIIRAIRLTWESLDSHLRRVPDSKANRRERKLVGSVPFHNRCVREYAEIIKTLADTL